MRVYLPVTLPMLAGAHQSQAFNGGLGAHAVTPAVREWYTEGEEEELEYTALIDAAAASLRLLADDPSAPRRRVVVAAQVPDGVVRPGGLSGTADRSAVVLSAAVSLSDVVSLHIDEVDAEDAVAEAIQALPAADAGDEDARFVLDEAEARDLLWYDVTELADLVPSTGGS